MNNKQRKGRFEHNFSHQQVNTLNKRQVRPPSKERIELGVKEMLISGNNCTVSNNQFYNNKIGFYNK